MKIYLEQLQKIMDQNIEKPDRTGIGTRSLHGIQMRFLMEEGFPAITTKKLFWRGVKEELLWFLKGSSDARELQQKKVNIWNANAQADYWKHKAKFPGDLGRIYGVQWRKWRSYDPQSTHKFCQIDQIKRLIEEIKINPYSRRLIVNAWNAGELEQMALPPCHVLFQLLVHEKNKLSLILYQRSGDMFLGVPFNIASYSLLLHMIAQVTDLIAYEFIHIIGDAHIYKNHFKQVQTQLKRKPYPLPKLWLNPQIKNIDEFTSKDIKLINYKHHPAIKAEMAV